MAWAMLVGKVSMERYKPCLRYTGEIHEVKLKSWKMNRGAETHKIVCRSHARTNINLDLDRYSYFVET